jgi:hypothetical protein
MKHDPDDMMDPEQVETSKGVVDDDITIRNAKGAREYDGKPLQPWTAFRQASAQRMGMRFGRIASDEATAFKSNGIYDGIFADAVIAVWLCLQPQNKVLRAYRLPDEALCEAMTWAEASRISYPNEGAAELIKLFVDIVSDVGRVTGQYKARSEALVAGPKKGNSSRRRG